MTTFAENIFVTVLVCSYKRSSGRHKHSSGRSVSEAVPHFGNLHCMCVGTPALFRRSLPVSSTAVLQTHFGKAFQMSASFFVIRTVYHLVEWLRATSCRLLWSGFFIYRWMNTTQEQKNLPRTCFNLLCLPIEGGLWLDHDMHDMLAYP